MTDEQKKILLQELCCRLPYGVILRIDIQPGGYINRKLSDISNISVNEYYKLEQVKHYLRPMESMTEEEKKFYDVLCRMDDEYAQPYDSCHLVNWLLEHHFDWRGLIKIGLALEALDGMYNFK